MPEKRVFGRFSVETVPNGGQEFGIQETFPRVYCGLKEIIFLSSFQPKQ
jgi:hypothetical protein